MAEFREKIEAPVTKELLDLRIDAGAISWRKTHLPWQLQMKTGSDDWQLCPSVPQINSSREFVTMQTAVDKIVIFRLKSLHNNNITN